MEKKLLDKLFDELQDKAYHPDHYYEYKQANQTIRAFFESNNLDASPESRNVRTNEAKRKVNIKGRPDPTTVNPYDSKGYKRLKKNS